MDDNTQLDKVEDSTEQIPDTVRTQLSVESLIKTLISRIARVKEDLKPVKEMLSDLLNNNEKYQLAANEAKEASKKKSTVKKEILSTPEGKMASGKVDELKSELKEAQEALSTYLAEYQKLTGSSEIEGEDGELRKIVYVAKLVKKTNLER
jgi:cell division FtsZ-interacting protein ZapD